MKVTKEQDGNKEEKKQKTNKKNNDTLRSSF